MMRRATIGVAGLVALAAASAWWLSGARAPAAPPGATTGPDWYFDDATLTATGADGALVYRNDAPHNTHHPDDDTALLESPRVVWLQGDGPPLLIRAARGHADATERRVALSGGVMIVDESTGTRVEFHSPDLVVDAVRRIASTASAVRVSSVHGELRGIGLLADMDAKTIRLESSVEGRYAP